jgi:hypothetical protein
LILAMVQKISMTYPKIGQNSMYFFDCFLVKFIFFSISRVIPVDNFIDHLVECTNEYHDASPQDRDRMREQARKKRLEKLATYIDLVLSIVCLD